MAKYKKNPIVVEAFQYDGDMKGSDGKYYVPVWAVEALKKGRLFYVSFSSLSPSHPPYDLYVKTLEGNIHVSVGDYIIQGINGEVYPCKPDIFEESYELIGE